MSAPEQTAALLELIAENPGIEAAELRVRTSWDWEADDAITVADLEKAGKAVCKNYGWRIPEKGDKLGMDEGTKRLGEVMRMMNRAPFCDLDDMI